MNQYGSVNGQGLGYDGNFNVTSHNGVSFSYDAQNRLVGGSMQVTYDGLGRCVRRTTSSGTRLYTYDDWNPIFEWDQWGNFAGWTMYGSRPDEILVRWDAAHGPIIYKQDQHGNVVALLDSGGNIVERYSYDAFGKPRVTGFWDDNDRGGSWYGNRFMFTGREYFPELGIYDYRNRYYQPQLGRFLQTDPLGFGAGDMNLFRYCGDDPVDRSDPTGLLDTATAIWNMAKFFDSSNTSQDSLGDLNRQQSLSLCWIGLAGMIDAARVDSVNVRYVERPVIRMAPEEIAQQKDPGVDWRTKSYTLPVIEKTQVDARTGSITVPVSAKTVLPNNTTKYDQKEREQRVHVIESVFKANAAVKNLARQGFSEGSSAVRLVETLARRTLVKENQRRIIQTDILNEW